MRTNMLWHKAWLETRWRFVIGLVLLMLSAGSTVIAYPEVLRLMPLAGNVDTSSVVGRRIYEAAELARSYRGYVWSQWFSTNLLQMWSIFAVLLGSGGLVAQSSGGGALYTLSLPATRTRLVGTRAATALLELLALAFVPSLLLVVLSPAIGQHYSAIDALVHAACLFVGGAILFSLAFLMSTLFSDVWRPIAIALCAAAAFAFVEQFVRGLPQVGLFRLMSAEAYFRHGGLPWLGLAIATALSAAMLAAANRNIARQDF